MIKSQTPTLDIIKNYGQATENAWLEIQLQILQKEIDDAVKNAYFDGYNKAQLTFLN